MQNPHCEGHNRGQGGQGDKTESGRAEKESQIEEGTDAIDETAGNKRDTKSADMTAIGMHSGDGASGAHVEALTVTHPAAVRLSCREEQRTTTTVGTIGRSWARRIREQ